MSLSSTTARNDYTGNGSTAVYSYIFKILAATDLKVTKRDTSNVETLLVLNTDYTVTGVGFASGGSITLTAGNLPTGYKLTIRRVRPLTQTTDIRNQGPFYPEIHEDAFDHQVMLAQQQQDEIDRAIKLPETVTGVSTELPVPTALHWFRWNSLGTALENVTAAVMSTIATIGKGLKFISGNLSIKTSDLGWVDASDYATLWVAIDAIGATETTLRIYAPINAASSAIPVTVPTNILLQPMRGGVINKSSATSLTINGPVVGNPMHQWLSGFAAGQVIGLKSAKAEWFGTIPLAISSNGVIELEKTDYTVDSVINPAEGQVVKGQGMSATATRGTRLTLNFDNDLINLGGLFQRLENFYVDCNTKNGNGIYLVCNYATLKNIQVKNGKTGYWALNINGASHNSYYDIYVIDCQNGINMSGGGGGGSGSFSSFYGCCVLSDNGLMETAVKLSVTSVLFAVNFYNLLIGPGVGKALEINNISGSIIDGIYLEAAFLNTTDLITITGTSTHGFSIKNGVISQTHASFSEIFIKASGGGKNLSFENLYINKVSSDTSDVLNFDGIVGVSVKNCELNAPAGSYFLSDASTTEGIIIENFVSANTTTITFDGSKHRVIGGTSNTTIDIRATANDITIENFPGTITINSLATHIVLINCTGSITDTGNVSVQLGALQAANADTSGATLANLEIEVNQLKQLLRDVGLMAT